MVEKVDVTKKKKILVVVWHIGQEASTLDIPKTSKEKALKQITLDTNAHISPPLKTQIEKKSMLQPWSEYTDNIIYNLKHLFAIKKNDKM